MSCYDFDVAPSVHFYLNSVSFFFLKTHEHFCKLDYVNIFKKKKKKNQASKNKSDLSLCQSSVCQKISF